MNLMQPRVELAKPLLWRGGYFLIAFAYCLFLQSWTGAWQDSFVVYPDEPAHFVGSIMVRDWLTSGQWATPLEFARDYYAHYPYFALGYWPPGFSVIAALLSFPFGVGRVQALLVPALFAAGSALVLFAFLRRRTGPLPAACAGFVFLTLPASQQWVCAVMVDHMTACLSLLSAWLVIRFLDHPSFRVGVAVGLATAFTIHSKYNASYLLFLTPAACVATRRYSLLRQPGYWIQPLLVILIVGPWVYLTRGMATQGLDGHHSGLTLDRVWALLEQISSLFPAPLLLAVVIPGVLVAAGSMFVRGKLSGATDEVVLFLLCCGQSLLLLLAPIGMESRYLLTVAGAILILAVHGWIPIASWLNPRLPSGPVFRSGVLVVASAAFVAHYAGQYPRPQRYPIRETVEALLHPGGPCAGSAECRILAPSGLEGAFIAEFIAHQQRMPRYRGYRIVRPGKVLARQTWLEQNYVLLYPTPEAMMAYFRDNPVDLLVWWDHPDAERPRHERMLHEVLRRYPGAWTPAWRSSGTPERAWTLFRQAGSGQRPVSADSSGPPLPLEQKIELPRAQSSAHSRQ